MNQYPYAIFAHMKSAKHKIVKEKVTITELSIHNQVCKYLKLLNVMFLSDFAAGIKLSAGMANRQSMQKSNHAFPDIHILEPRNGKHGLFIELKRDVSALYNKNGTYIKSEHIEAQRACIVALNEKGYHAQFCCGFDEAKTAIDNYLK